MEFHWVVLVTVSALCIPTTTAVGYGDLPRNITDNDAKVLILGGGPAGIKAAADLIEYGFSDIIILEGSARLRGYLAPIEFDGKTFAPGSLWGYLQDKLNEFGISYKESDIDSLVIRNDQGEDVTDTPTVDQRREALEEARTVLEEVAADIDAGKRPDVSQKVALARGGWVETSDIDRALEWYNFDFIEGISTRDTSTAGPYRQKNLTDGEYFILDDDTLGEPLLGGSESMFEEGHVRLNQFAVSVDSTDETTVKVVTQDGTEYTGHFIVVANTVGVLQHGAVTFDPPLPEWKTEEIFRAQMGTIDPIFMKFDTKFWDDAENILHASDRPGYYPGFLNLEADGLYQDGTNILIGFLTGDEAYRAEFLDDDEVQAEVIEVLRAMYGAENVPDPTEFYMSRFATDPYLYGSFSTWPIGSIPKDAMDRLAGNVGRLYFALEDAGDEYIGIPFGAVQAGKKAAEAIRACYSEDTCPVFEPEDSAPCKEDPHKPYKSRKDFSWRP